MVLLRLLSVVFVVAVDTSYQLLVTKKKQVRHCIKKNKKTKELAYVSVGYTSSPKVCD